MGFPARQESGSLNRRPGDIGGSSDTGSSSSVASAEDGTAAGRDREGMLAVICCDYRCAVVG